MDLSITKDFNILEEALQQAAALAPRILMGFLVFCAFWIASIVFRKIILRVRWPIPGDILGLAERAGEIALIVMGILTGLGTMGIGLAVGVTLTAFITRAMASALFGVTPLDIVAFSTAPFILSVVASFACLIAARRAVAIDPAEALKAE